MATRSLHGRRLIVAGAVISFPVFVAWLRLINVPVIRVTCSLRYNRSIYVSAIWSARVELFARPISFLSCAIDFRTLYAITVFWFLQTL